MPNMQLATNHIVGMMKTHHPERSRASVLFVPPFGQGVPFNFREDRKFYIDWAAGSTPDDEKVLVAIANYEEKGFRCVAADINGLTSDIRMVKGELSAGEEYRLILESRSLQSFEYNADTCMFELQFGPRVKNHSELDKFELDKLAFLDSIKTADLMFGPDGAFIQVKSFYLSDTNIKSEGWPDYKDPTGCPDCTVRENCHTCVNEKKHNAPLGHIRRLCSQHCITDLDYMQMEFNQDKKCALCKQEKSLDIDHDHITGKVRGLLCQNCNVGLGQFKDNIEVLKRSH